MDVHNNENVAEQEEESAACTNRGLFNCPVANCIADFSRYKALENHLLAGKHKIVEWQQTATDIAARAYSEFVQAPTIQFRHPAAIDIQENPVAGIAAETAAVATITGAAAATNPFFRGWAVHKITKEKQVRFNAEQRKFLIEEFQKGRDNPSKKVDPKQVEARMHTLFQPDQWLTHRQIASFFQEGLQKFENTAIGQALTSISRKRLQL